MPRAPGRLARADHRPRTRASILPILLALSLETACASAGEPMPEVAAEVNATLDRNPDRFAPGDSLLVRFAHDSNLDQTVRVDPAGKASFLLVGSLSVVGKSPSQLEGELRTAYASMLSAPDLSVNLLGPEVGSDEPLTGRAFHVLGEVEAPGAFPVIGQQVTLVEALARAGGTDKTSALLKQVLLVRWMPEQRSWRGWKIDARQRYWRAPQQILLQASDLVYVPNTPIDRVNIWIDKYLRQMIPFPYLIPPVN